MADEPVDLATKAPENDAEPSDHLIPGDTPAQTGASMGEHCTSDRPSPGEAPTGEIIQIADVDCYVARPTDYPHTSAKLLLLLSTGTGMKSNNNQIQADRFASEGFLVVMPDMFNDDAFPNPPALDVDGPMSPSTIEQLKLGFAHVVHATTKTFQIDMWLARQTPEKVMPILRKVLEGINQEFADAVSYGGGIYAVGYCFGGRYVLLLSSDNASNRSRNENETVAPKEGPLIKAGVCAHGTQVSEEDIGNVNRPVCFVCVDDDPFFPNDVRDEGQKLLESKNVPHELKIYPNVPHGFAVVGEYPDERIKTAQKEAYDQMLHFLKAH